LIAALWRDLRYAVRIQARTPWLAALILFVLALGIGANSAIFSVVNAVLLRPLPFRDPARLYQIDEVSPKGQPSGVSPLDLDTFRKSAGSIEQGAVSRWYNATIAGPEGQENLYGAKASRELFATLGVQPALGRGFRPDEFEPGAPGVVLVTDRLWKRRYAGDPKVIGRQVMMNGEAFTILGVLPRDFFFGQRFEFWIPWQFTAGESGKRDERWPAVVRLKAGAAVAQAQTEIEAVFQNAAPTDVGNGWKVRLLPLHERVTAGSRPALLILLGAVAFVLLIACLNVANLLLARGAERSREMAIRAALGAGRARVFRQLLTESLLLAGAGGAVGVALGGWGAGVLVRFVPEGMAVPRLDQTRLDFTVVLATLAVVAITGILFGLAPAWQALRTNVNEALKAGGRTGGGPRTGFVRNTLVVLETALSLVLLAGAGLMLRSLSNLLLVDPGFRPERVLTMRVPLPVTLTERPQQVAYVTRLLDAVRQAPGLNSSGLITPLPLGGVDANANFAVEGRPVPPGERQLVKLRVASAGYFRAMGLTLRSGRVLTEADGEGAPDVVVINDALAKRYFPNENPIGRRVSMSAEGRGPWMPVVGVVGDVKSLNLAEKSEPEMYRDYRQFFFAPFAATIVARTNGENPAAISGALQRQIRTVNPEQAISDVTTMDELVSHSVAQPRFYTMLLIAFAAIALMLAAAGLYGVLSYSVSRRVREIGIRIALGASRGRILREVVGRAMILVCGGLVLGIAGAWALTRLLSAQLFAVSSTDPATFAGVSALLFVVASCAAYVPARRATRIDPNTALRCE
jgi:putative ABC transport system permease protein